MAWCGIGYRTALSGWVGRDYQAATAGARAGAADFVRRQILRAMRDVICEVDV